MTRSAPGAGFGRPSAADAKLVVRYQAGRVCESPDCVTVLSAYNPSPTCWQHTPRSYRRSSAGPD